MLRRVSVPPMPPTTFVARRPGPFSALVQAAEIGGLRLEPLPLARVTDRYYDTDTGDLVRSGLALRVREQDGRRTASLRAVEGGLAADAPDDEDLADGSADAPLALPPGPLLDAVRRAAGEAPLLPLLSLRQYRTPRVAHDAQGTAVLSFNVVVYEVPGERVVSSEVEVEARSGDPLAQLAPAFRAAGLDRAERSTFARALLRSPRLLSEPVLLLPDEVEALERAAASGDLQLRRRASVVLLDARGFRPDTIAAQTGMSMTRVSYWRQRFREIRLGVLEREPAAPTRRPAERPAPERPPQPSIEAGPPPATSEPEGPRTPPRPAAGGDGMPAQLPPEAGGVADMAELLELFTPAPPNTPLLDSASPSDLAEDDDPTPETGGRPSPAPGGAPVAPSPSGGGRAEDDEETTAALRPGRRFPPPRLNPYPVVLGPVRGEGDGPTPVRAAAAAAPTAQGSATGPFQDPFAEIDLQALRFDRAAPTGANGVAPAQPDARVAAEVGDGPETGAAEPTPSRAALAGDTPLLNGAHQTLARYLDAFGTQADAFRQSRAPSDARRLLGAAQRLRVAAETFGPALPAQAGPHLVAGLRPLAEGLAQGVDAASRATRAPARRDRVRAAVYWMAASARRLDGDAHREWAARTERLLDHLDRQRKSGLVRSDFAAPAPDDWVGEPGTAPGPARVRHVLAPAVWARFEAVRACEPRLAAPDGPVHLAVALSALRLVLGWVEPPSADLAAALDAAERAVTGARLGADPSSADPSGDARAVAAHVLAEVTAGPFRQRLAAVVAAV